MKSQRSRGGLADWQTSVQQWGGGALVFNAPIGTQTPALPIIGIQPNIGFGPGVNSVPVSRVKIKEIDLTLDIVLATASPASLVNYGAAIFKCQATTDPVTGLVTAWSTRSPLNGVDAQRDDYLLYEVGTAWLEDAPTISQHGIRIKRRVKCNVVLGAGEGIMLVIQNGKFSNGGFFYNSFLRWKQEVVS